jgi:hypothetical protein
MASVVVTCTWPQGFKALPLGPNQSLLDILPPNLTDGNGMYLLGPQSFTSAFQATVDSASWTLFKAAYPQLTQPQGTSLLPALSGP